MQTTYIHRGLLCPAPVWHDITFWVTVVHDRFSCEPWFRFGFSDTGHCRSGKVQKVPELGTSFARSDNKRSAFCPLNPSQHNNASTRSRSSHAPASLAHPFHCTCAWLPCTLMFIHTQHQFPTAALILQHLPFAWPTNKAVWAAKLVLYLGTGFSIPFVAVWFQLWVAIKLCPRSC
jgi:hypothetical protein